MFEILVRDSRGEHGPPRALGEVVEGDGQMAAQGLHVFGLILKAQEGF